MEVKTKSALSMSSWTYCPGIMLGARTISVCGWACVGESTQHRRRLWHVGTKGRPIIKPAPPPRAAPKKTAVVFKLNARIACPASRARALSHTVDPTRRERDARTAPHRTARPLSRAATSPLRATHRASGATRCERDSSRASSTSLKGSSLNPEK